MQTLAPSPQFLLSADSGYKNEGLGQKARTGGHLKADSSYKQQQLSGPPRPVKLEYGQAGTQGRSQLRKRDFETELLERLLGHGTKGMTTKASLQPFQGPSHYPFLNASSH